ncbi:MAG: hypothetical protein H6672_03030 [Anaerolineaceae bacterium]|nr:hypothetical protein [Anaerolineaceae bacterium]
MSQSHAYNPISLAIYNQGTSLVRERRMVDLQSGLNTLDFTDVAAHIDATSVTLVSITDPTGTIVLEQTFLYDLVSGLALLKRYLEQTIEITVEDGTRFVGQLLSLPDDQLRRLGMGDGSLILRQSDGQIAYIQVSKIRDMRFPALPDGLMIRPTLRWLLQSTRAGSQEVELTYLTDGLNWTADYNLLLAVDNQALDFSGWVTFTNTSGGTFAEAQVKLVAGDVKRLPKPKSYTSERLGLVMAAGGAPRPQVEQHEFFEYQLYEIKRPVTLAHNETKQVEFLTKHGVPAHTFYVYEGSQSVHGRERHPLIEQHYGQANITHVQTWLEFSTGAEAGLDADLPEGRMRVYQQDSDGAAILIGENQAKHTPKGETVSFELGKAFDLVGERHQMNFRKPQKNSVEETYEIRLRNRKDTDTVEVRVPENLFRWSNWEIIEASHAYTRLDVQTIEFRVDVPPGRRTVITYTVRYSWPG